MFQTLWDWKKRILIFSIVTPKKKMLNMRDNKRINMKSWDEKVDDLVNSGKINDMIRNDLFNYTWRISTKIAIDNLDLKNKKSGMVLDAGFGWGRIIVGLKYYLPELRVTGVELTEKFVKTAKILLRNLNMDAGVNLKQGNLINCELGEDKYDAFCSARVLHYIEEKEYVLLKLYKSLKNRGKGLIIIPNRYCPYRWFTYKHAPLYSILKVKQIMEKVGFKNVRIGGYGFIPPIVNFSFKSPVCHIEDILDRIPIMNYLGALAYAIGEK